MEPQLQNQQTQSSSSAANQNVSKTSSSVSSLAAPAFQVTSGANQTNESKSQSAETWDSHTNRRIAGIHPKVQPYAYALVNRAQSELGIKLRVTSGLRTFGEQDELYAKGRTTGGKKVTNAKGGQSFHNYGLAIDVVEITEQKTANWNMDWAAVGALGESIGWEWGGNWSSFVDKPHFQMAFGLTTTQLRSMYNANGGNFVNLDDKAAPEIPETGTTGGQTTGGDSSTGNTNTTHATPGTYAIQASVGKGGANEYDDVKIIQTLLNKAGASLKVDGDAGPLTIGAIEAFQMGQFGWKDGRVDVNGKTFGALEKSAAPKPMIYTVKRGDNLTKIAKQFNTTLAAIVAANPSIKNSNVISIGQKITIPVPGSTTSTPAPDTNGPGNETSTGGGGTNQDPGEGGNTGLIYGSKVSTEFAEKVILIAGELGVNPNYLMAAMAFETGGTFSPKIKNPNSSATGLIQFMEATAKWLGTSTAALAKMSAVEQLDWVKLYFQKFPKVSTLEDVYMAILWPKGIGKPNDYVLWSRGTSQYRVNSGLDTNNDGTVTKAEAAGKVRERYELGKEDIVNIGNASTTEETATNDSAGGSESESNEQGSESESTTETDTGSSGGTPATANFKMTEFNSRDGVAVPEKYYANLQELMNNLEIIRAELGGNSIRINSGYRSPKHNKNEGGAPGSKHLLAQAADIVVTGYTARVVHATILRLINENKIKQGGLGKYETFTHYDIRGTAARWNG